MSEVTHKYLPALPGPALFLGTCDAQGHGLAQWHGVWRKQHWTWGKAPLLSSSVILGKVT